MLVACWAVLLSTHLGAQTLAQRTFDHLDGVPQSAVGEILEDRDGFIWAGTQVGLVRLGAFSSQTFGSFQGLKDGNVSALYQDQNGTVWVGRDQNGIAAIRGSRVIEYQEATGLLVRARVSSFCEDSSNQLYVGTNLGLFAKRGEHFERIPLPSFWDKLPVMGISRDSSNGLWLGFRNGKIAHWDGQQLIPTNLPEEANGMDILMLRRDNKGDQWALGQYALFHLGPDGKWEKDPLPGAPQHVRFRNFRISQDGELILTLQSEGLYIRDGNGNSRVLTYRDGLPRQPILTAMRDHHGVLWVGTDGGYLAALPIEGLRVLAEDPESGLNLRLGGVSSFLELSPDRMLIGSDSGLFLWEANKGITQRWTKAQGLPNQDVMALYAAQPGGAWVGTQAGLMRWHNGRIEPGPKELDHISICSIMSDKNRLWVSTYQGLFELELNGRYLKRHILPQEVIPPGLAISALAQPDGILVNTESGLFLLKGDEFIRPFADPLPTHNLISCMDRDTDGSLWLGSLRGTYGFRNGESKPWIHYDEDHGQVFDKVAWSRRLPNGFLCIGHTRGITLIRGDERVHLSRNVGFLANETMERASYFDSKQRLWMGVVGGVCILDPQFMPKAFQIPRPIILEARCGTSNTWLPLDLRLPPNPDSVTFTFDMGMPLISDTPRYEIRMEGLDDGWRPVERKTHSIQIANLGPGEYHLRIRATLDGSSWVESKVLPIHVQWAWYQMRVVRLLFVLLGLALIALFVNLRAKKLKGQNQELEIRVQERTRSLELRNESNERLHRQLKQSLESRIQLMNTVNHDLRSPITSILLAIDLLKSSDNSGARTQSTLDMVGREAQRMDRLIKNLLDQSKAESTRERLSPRLCHPSEFIRGLRDIIQLKALARGLQTKVTSDAASDLAWILADSASIEQVIFNLVENALKFTDAPGQVGVDSKVGFETWELTVWDTGRGIDPEKLKGIFKPFEQTQIADTDHGWGLGLSICQSLVEANHGHIEVESVLGKGSTFRLILPLVLSKDPKQETQLGSNPSEYR